MVLQNLCIDLIQRRINGLDLTDHVNTISILLHHTYNTTEVPFNSFQTSKCIFIFHGYLRVSDAMTGSALTPPQGGGDNIPVDRWSVKNLGYEQGHLRS